MWLVGYEDHLNVADVRLLYCGIPPSWCPGSSWFPGFPSGFRAPLVLRVLWCCSESEDSVNLFENSAQQQPV